MLKSAFFLCALLPLAPLAAADAHGSNVITPTLRRDFVADAKIMYAVVAGLGPSGERGWSPSYPLDKWGGVSWDAATGRYSFDVTWCRPQLSGRLALEALPVDFPLRKLAFTACVVQGSSWSSLNARSRLI